jgi:hypothetical protein
VKKDAETFYSIKYWETCGIETVTLQADEADEYASTNTGRINGYRFERIGRDCFRTIGGARQAAEVKRLKKIKSLRAQVQRLEDGSFLEVDKLPKVKRGK